MTHPRRTDQARRDEPRGGAPHGAPPEAVRVRMLGGFRVSVGLRTVEEGEWRLRKAAGLVKLLALAPKHQLHREQLMDLLWPGAGVGRAGDRLRYALHVARRIIEPAPTAANYRYLQLRGGQIVLCPEGELWVDVEAFEEAAAAARRSRDPLTYEWAIDLYAGDLLPQDLYEEWAEGRRAQLRRDHLELLLELAALCEEREEYGRAAKALRRAVAAEPSHEGAHVGLMRLYALSGQRQEALGQYQRLRQALWRKYATDPGPEAMRLHEEIRAGGFPPARSRKERPREEPPSVPRRHNLPVALTSFVGRERELVEVKRALAMTRLLTLTGVGGSGKTRLALEAAKDLVGSYPDGVWLVELAGLSEPGLVPQAAASAAGVREQPGRPVLETLAGALREKKLLLVLDNCEHLIGALARLVETLAGSCPDLRLLATSREALSVASELVRPVPPLPVPEAGESLAPEALAGYESARLFAERARYRNPAFALTPGNAQAVVEICLRLGGIPLAIELAAAYAGMLSAEQIARKLGDSLKLLTRGDQAASPRQRTLRGAMDWSHGLLSEPERKLFRRLSVFAGGWTLEAAEAVGAGGGIEQGDVLDLLAQLIDRSLVMVEASVEATPRHRMLEPVRQYARERLKEGREAGEVRRRHAVWFLGLAEEAESGLIGARQGEWLERLEAEHDNLRAALSWSLGRREAGLGLRLAAALRWFWYARGRLSEGRRWLERALALNGPATTRARAWALNGAGWIALFQGDFEEAKAFLEQGLTMFRTLEDGEGVASTLANLGFVALMGQRDDIPVPALLEEARELRPELRNRRTTAYLLLLEGVAAIGRGDLAHSMRLHEESLALLREVSDAQAVGGCLFNMGLIEAARADYPRATELHRGALRVACEADDKTIIQLALFGLANAAARRGRPARAALLWGASEAVREAFGMRLSPMTRSFAGYEGNLSAARSRLDAVAFEEAWAEGKAMTAERATECALSEGEDAAPPMPPPLEEPPSEKASGKLTRREEEIAALVAQGLTNRQIAQELTLSRRTVDTHVSKILKKLGLRSREQVAARMDEQLPHGDC